MKRVLYLSASLIGALGSAAAAPLIDGLGGPIGLGEPAFAAPSTSFDLRSAPASGLRLYDAPLHERLYVNRPGSLSFDDDICCFNGRWALPAPASAQGLLMAPRLVPFQARGVQQEFDVQGPETFMYAATDVLDDGTERFIATWHDVPNWPEGAPRRRFNSWQAVVTPVGDAGDFDLELRFERCEWLTEGDLANRPLPLFGFDAGLGEDGPGWMWPGSQSEDTLLLCALSNVREPGVFRYRFRDGWPEGCGYDAEPPPGADRCADGNHLPGDGCSPACYVEADVDRDGRFEAPHPDAVDPLGVYDPCSDPGDPDCDDDLDDDMVPDLADNCPEVPNPAQHDYDDDRIGDVCDRDADGDNLWFPADPDNDLEHRDICPLMHNRGTRDNDPDQQPFSQQSDLDGDGLGDHCDDDDDGDGVIDCGADGICAENDNGADDDRDLTTDEGDECALGSDRAERCATGRDDLVDNDGDGFVDERSESALPRAWWPGPDPPGPGAEDNCRRIPNPGQGDLDGDLIGDACDPDADGDGVDTCLGGHCGPALDFRDNDRDGRVDEEAECAVGCPEDDDVADQDHDGFVDEAAELDGAQPFGAPLDNCPRVPNADQADQNGDGEGDACADDDMDDRPGHRDNCPDTPNPEQVDLDEDGRGDACDPDDDGDGVADPDDRCPRLADDQSDQDGDGLGDACDGDVDGDGTDNGADTCPRVPDRDQIDTDGDGRGDACDDDDDGDGVPDGDDICPLSADGDQRDTDGDGAGDACDDDDDDDRVPDVDDLCPLIADPRQPDLDGDRLGDACDPDDDDDGVDDPVDVCPTVADDQRDTDGDGAGDACDDDDDGDGVDDARDGCPRVPDAAQADLDGDGVGDVCDATDDRPFATRTSAERCALLIARGAPTAERVRHCPPPAEDGCAAAPGRAPTTPALLLGMLLLGARRRPRGRVVASHPTLDARRDLEG